MSTFTIQFLQGSTYTLEITYQDSDGVAIDITGFTARAVFRYDSKSSLCALALTEGNGLTTTPLLGKIDLVVTPAQTKTLTRDMVYDLEIFTSGDADVIRLLEGNATLNREVNDCV